MIKEIKVYTVICDCCGQDINQNANFAGWRVITDALTDAHNNDWFTIGIKNYCFKCYIKNLPNE